MDFSLSEEQSELLGLAKKIFKDMTGDESLRAVEAADGLHRELWAALGDAVSAGSLSKWAMPEDIRFVDEIAKTSVGKIDKKALRAALT